MATVVELLGRPEVRELPIVKPLLVPPLDEGRWQAWLAKGQAEDKRRSYARLKAVEWVSITVLLLGVALWAHVAPYEVLLRFIVTAGAMFVMFQAFQDRRYAIAVVFGALAALYNPLAPAFSFSGDWQRAVVLGSTAPFVMSLAWRSSMPAF